jgi:hypothetical protein
MIILEALAIEYQVLGALQPSGVAFEKRCLHKCEIRRLAAYVLSSSQSTFLFEGKEAALDNVFLTYSSLLLSHEWGCKRPLEAGQRKCCLHPDNLHGSFRCPAVFKCIPSIGTGLWFAIKSKSFIDPVSII